jgi:hypothetical protein
MMSTVMQTPIKLIEISIFPDGRMDVVNAARYLGLKEKTLAMFRSQGSGPLFIKLGRIFYFKEDLDAWVQAASKVASTTQLGKIQKEDK